MSQTMSHFRPPRLVSRRFVLLVAGLFAGIAVGGSAVADGRPNILFLMADDWSYPHAGVLGDPVVKTPVFDRLVREGVLFDKTFVSAPSCTPSRHSVASGQHHWRLGGGDSLWGSIPADTPVYPDLLAAAGYHTGFCRKGTAPSKLSHRGNDPFGPRFKNFEEFLAKRKPDQPFCFWYGSGDPHRPYKWQEGKDRGMDLDAVEVPACLPDNPTVRTDLGDYYARVERFDRDCGRMLALLEKSGELDHTIVVISGDNGMPFPRCKATLYDLGTRVPLVIRWGDKAKGGRKIDDFVSLTDLAPTFLEAAGLPVPGQMTGRSLMPQLRSEKTGLTDPQRDHVLTGMERHVYPNPSRAIRTAGFLYIRNFAPAGWKNGRVKGKQAHYDFVKTPWPTGPGAFSFNVDPSPSKQWMLEHPRDGDENRLNHLAFGRRPNEELYDLRKDPGQVHNLAADPACRESRDRLSQMLTAELRAGGDPRFALDHYTSFPIHGWSVHLSDALWSEQPKKTSLMLDLLAAQLDRVAKAVPRKALQRLRTVPVWISPPYEGHWPKAEYHPNPKWLENNGRDIAMGKAVEITNVAIFRKEDRRMPYLLLHELAHAYHDQVLGFDDKEILAAYKKAKLSGSYDAVEYRDGNGKTTKTARAYAMTNHKEYFSETTEAFFGTNDIYPFNRADLKKHDPRMYELLRKKWGLPEPPSGGE